MTDIRTLPIAADIAMHKLYIAIARMLLGFASHMHPQEGFLSHESRRQERVLHFVALPGSASCRIRCVDRQIVGDGYLDHWLSRSPPSPFSGKQFQEIGLWLGEINPPAHPPASNRDLAIMVRNDVSEALGKSA
ncbi:hypothetical protein OHD62_35045 [Mesorhizobium sp. YC-39]|uniref:Uncharacterized protein n=1 Tax=Mesorhizobium robiniae TaxID=559315 RepID=A0ABV2GZA2_9HYPH|nr:MULTISPECIES: hypothetical protein [unclassified Mesorhizobium]MCV3211846.1 hypothetical protein [Mesorhizobium sp. YC-2]MCV3233558.1 hypothetical protein [Mesorhizobium sp. YC-39]MCV3244067.1 hypothetical protein [Mesorhizobium sp. ZC-5]